MSDDDVSNSKISRQAGYSLVEMIFSVTFLSIFLGQVILAFLWSQRAYQDAICTCEITTASRMLREKALYHLVEDGGVASMNLDTGAVRKDGDALEFSVGRDEAEYLLTYDPISGENGFDFVYNGGGTDESLLSRLSTKTVNIQGSSDSPLFRLEELSKNGDDEWGEDGWKEKRTGGRKEDTWYRLRGDFVLELQNGDKTYERGCRIQVPIANENHM